MVDLNLGGRPYVPFIPVELTKARVDELLSCMRDDKPITPETGVWMIPELLALAGAAIAIVESQGPCIWATAFSSSEQDFNALQDEDRERVLSQLRTYLGGAVGAYNRLALAALHDHWPNMYESEVELAIIANGQSVGIRGVRPRADG